MVINLNVRVSVKNVGIRRWRKIRELLFRGQQRRKGEKVHLNGSPVASSWVYGNGVLQGKGDFSIIYQTEPTFEKYSVYTDTLGQYTGLNDKNGKKIFEGDIVEFQDGVPDDIYHEIEITNRGVMLFSSGQFYVTDRYVVHMDDLILYDTDFDGEVIGNIHDNPDLLEV